MSYGTDEAETRGASLVERILNVKKRAYQSPFSGQSGVIRGGGYFRF
jgi:hypothetical protein